MPSQMCPGCAYEKAAPRSPFRTTLILLVGAARIRTGGLLRPRAGDFT